MSLYCVVHGIKDPCPECAKSLIGHPMVWRDSGRAGIAGVFEAIVRERGFQDKKYGEVTKIIGDDTAMGGPKLVQGPGGHELGAWLIVIEKELDEAKDALVHGGGKTAKGRNTIRAELVQIAAVAVAALEQHGVEET